MNVLSLSATELTPEQLASWSRVQQAERMLASPFFAREFTLAVASVRDDVEVAVLEEDGVPVGFFPFHRDNRDVAHPVGFGLSDCQGVIVPPDVRWTAPQLLQACGIRAWYFDHAIASQTQFAPYQWRTSESSYMDLSRGFRAYAEERRCSGHQILKRANANARKLEREYGPLRFVAHVSDDGIFRQLIEWKIEQYGRLRCVNHLAADWKVEVLRRIANIQHESFAGMLSVLYAGDHVVALHLGMRSGNTLHAWFPTYDRSFYKYSPGLLLWARLAENAESLGLHYVDLGKGDEHYKMRLRSGVATLVEGAVDSRCLTSVIHWSWWKAKEIVRASRFGGAIQGLIRGVRAQTTYRKVPSRRSLGHGLHVRPERRLPTSRTT